MNNEQNHIMHAGTDISTNSILSNLAVMDNMSSMDLQEDSGSIKNDQSTQLLDDHMKKKIMNIDDIQEMADEIQHLFKIINELCRKIDRLEEERMKPTGCGFSCSHNSLSM